MILLSGVFIGLAVALVATSLTVLPRMHTAFKTPAQPFEVRDMRLSHLRLLKRGLWVTVAALCIGAAWVQTSGLVGAALPTLTVLGHLAIFGQHIGIMFKLERDNAIWHGSLALLAEGPIPDLHRLAIILDEDETAVDTVLVGMVARGLILRNGACGPFVLTDAGQSYRTIASGMHGSRRTLLSTRSTP